MTNPRPAPHAPRRTARRTVGAIASVAAVLALALAESWSASRVPDATLVAALRPSTDPARCYEPAPRSGGRFGLPGLRSPARWLSFDARGLSVPSSLPVGSAAARAVVLGGDAIVGVGVEVRDSFPRALERSLRALGADVAVDGAGVPGYAPSQSLRWLTRVDPARTASLVLLAATDTDLDPPSCLWMDPHHGDPGLATRAWIRTSALARALALRHYGPADPDDDRRARDRDGLARVRADAGDLARLAHDRGASVAAVLLVRDRRLGTAHARALEEAGIPVFDAASMLPRYADTRWFVSDRGHLTAYGADRVAGAFAAFLAQRGLVTSTRGGSGAVTGP